MLHRSSDSFHTPLDRPTDVFQFLALSSCSLDVHVLVVVAAAAAVVVVVVVAVVVVVVVAVVLLLLVVVLLLCSEETPEGRAAKGWEPHRDFPLDYGRPRRTFALALLVPISSRIVKEGSTNTLYFKHVGKVPES